MKFAPSLPNGTQLTTRAEMLAPLGRSPSSTGVSIGKGRSARTPPPCELTTTAIQCAENGCMRSRLVMVRGISTRSRVLRLIVCGVRISMWVNFARIASSRVHSSLTEASRSAEFRTLKTVTEVILDRAAVKMARKLCYPVVKSDS